MATLLVATIDPTSGALRMASAGHPPPLLLEAGRTCLLDVKPSTPLGAPRSPVEQWHGTLAPASTLLFFTDGLVEDRQRGFQDGWRPSWKRRREVLIPRVCATASWPPLSPMKRTTATTSPWWGCTVSADRRRLARQCWF